MGENFTLKKPIDMSALPWIKAAELNSLEERKSRIHTRVQGRFVSLIRGERGDLYCIDSVCYHMGGPLTIGDIEEVNGEECVVCPWHNYPVTLKTGSKLYESMEFQNGKLQPSGWKASEKRQRVHEIEERLGGIYVRLSSTEVISRRSEDAEWQSDKWAFNKDAARNCQRTGAESGADGKRRFKSSDGKYAIRSRAGLTSNVGSKVYSKSGHVLEEQRKGFSLGISNTMDMKIFKPFTLLRKEKLTPSMFVFTFLLAKDQTLGILHVERHVQVRAVVEGEPIIREYTPISDLSKKGEFDLAIKLYENGKLSRVFSDMKIGDSVEMRGPFGTFTLKLRLRRGPPFIYAGSSSEETKGVPAKNITMFAGGSGITPMLQIIKESVHRFDVHQTLFFFNRCYEEIPFLPLLRQLQNDGNLALHLYCSAGPIPIGNEDITLGRFSTCLDKNNVCSPDSEGGSAIIICGPQLFNDAVQHWVKLKVGYRSDQVYVL